MEFDPYIYVSLKPCSKRYTAVGLNSEGLTHFSGMVPIKVRGAYIFLYVSLIETKIARNIIAVIDVGINVAII